jgi:hypothetical protein
MEKLSTRLTSVRERKEIDFYFNWLKISTELAKDGRVFPTQGVLLTHY